MRYCFFLIILVVIFVGCKKSDFTGSFSSGPRYYTLTAHKGNAAVVLDWNRAVACVGFSCPPAFDAIRYQVLISETDTSNMREYRLLPAGDKELTIADLKNGGTYFFKIKAIDAENRVEESNPVMIVPSPPLPTRELPFADHVYSAVVSADGRYTAYTTSYIWEENGMSYGTSALYIREEGGEPDLVYLGVSSPSWSPVENKLVFTTSSGRSNTAPGYRPERIGIYDVGSAGVEYIADGEYRNMYPVWSPDGQRIAALSDRDEQNTYNLWEVSRINSEERMIGPMEFPQYEVGSPMSWASDGQYIAFSAKKPLHWKPRGLSDIHYGYPNGGKEGGKYEGMGCGVPIVFARWKMVGIL